MLRYCAVVLTLLALFIASPSASAACTAAWSRWSSATSYRAPGRQFWVRYPHQLFHVPRLIPLEHASRAAKKDNKIPDDLQTKDLFRLMPLELKPLELELKRFERELELKPLERAPLDAKIYNKIPDDLQTMLEKAEQFELLSISPYPPKEKPADAFHGWEVLGKTTVKDAEVRKKLVAAFKKGVEANAGITADCFSPRHGIRVTRDGKTADFVICFECRRLRQKSIFGETVVKIALVLGVRYL